MNYQEILDFWFHEIDDAQRFGKSLAFDALIRTRFGAVWTAAAQGELAFWRDDIRGRLAEIIVLDQFSRNLFRDDARAFAQDGMALVLAQEALKLPEFVDLNETERQFLLLPLMHSESRAIHEQALDLFQRWTAPHVYDFEVKHQVIVARFGRYPHRNAILGRESSAEELAFLNEPNSSF